MPLCFFSYQDMIELKLSQCLLKPPATFKGFRTLKRVRFQRVALAQDVLENLILCCPLLESLEVINCDGFTHLKIDAPNLRFLSFSGLLEEVSLQNTLNLAVVHFNSWGIYHRLESQDHVSSSNLAKFFVDLPYIQRLTIDGLLVQYLAVGDLPGRLPKPCLHLNFLSLHLDFNVLAEILTTIYLLRSSPALKVLHVTDRLLRFRPVRLNRLHSVDEEAESWWDNLDDNINCSFPKLQFVQITDFFGCKVELDFIKFLLVNSPVLETMTIRALSANGSSEVLKKLLQLRRTSSAEIIYLDP